MRVPTPPRRPQPPPPKRCANTLFYQEFLVKDSRIEKSWQSQLSCEKIFQRNGIPLNFFNGLLVVYAVGFGRVLFSMLSQGLGVSGFRGIYIYYTIYTQRKCGNFLEILLHYL